MMPARSAPQTQREVDRTTLVRCRAGDPMAFRAFVVRYERPVHALLSRLLGHGPHVEDLAQETFLRAFDAFDRFDLDGEARPSTWLLTIATRMALDTRKHERVVQRAREMDQPVVGQPHQEAARAQLRHALEQAVAALPPDQRAALILMEYHEFTVEEVADALGIAEGTVKSRVMRAREKLREALAPWKQEA